MSTVAKVYEVPRLYIVISSTVLRKTTQLDKSERDICSFVVVSSPKYGKPSIFTSASVGRKVTKRRSDKTWIM